MKQSWEGRLGLWLALLALPAGCTALPPDTSECAVLPDSPPGAAPPPPQASVEQVGYRGGAAPTLRQPTDSPQKARSASEGATTQPDLPPPRPVKDASAGTPPSPFAGLRELTAEAVVAAVLARNPTLAQMAAAWEAASARYPQVTSLDDPTFAGTIGPETFAPDDRDLEFAYRLELAQTYPWPGKLGLRGRNALALAHAAGNEVGDVRLQLIEGARLALYDYYLVARALEVNEESLRLLREFRDNAEARYRTGLVPQQDVLQADVETGRTQERHLTLERVRQVAVARINTLTHLPPDLPLPPPPRTLALAEALPEPGALRRAALARRPDLKALADRIPAEEAALALAQKEFYPDLTPFVMYDRFMGNTSDNRDLATQLGVRLNVPVRLARRRAAVAEARARLAQRRAELARQADQVNFEVQQAYEQVLESERAVRLYEKEVLPAARRNVEAAQSAYTTGRIPFLSLIQAQRDRVGLFDRYYEALADYHRRRATLERAVGGPLTPPPAPGPGQPPAIGHLPPG